MSTYPPVPETETTYSETRSLPLTDRVRWASIIAGLFTVLSMLVLFTVLGIALGLSSFDANNPRSFGIGAGVYGIVSALIAFAIGGFVAARTASVTGTDNALLQSGLVWIVTIALIVNFIGSGVGTLLNVAGGAVSTAVDAASNVAGDAAEAVADNPAIQATVGAEATEAVPAVQATVSAVQDQVQQQLDNVSPEDVEAAARNASSAAWVTLLGLGASALAAFAGGFLGRRREVNVLVDTRTRRVSR